MIWDEKYECMPREELRELQLERLKETVKRVYERVPHYTKAFDEAGVKPEDIKTLDDLTLLPFTTKDDLRENYPFGMFAVPLKEVVRIHSSSGTTGKPTVVGYTKNDLETWSELVARFLIAGGVTDEDVIQNAFGYGLFTGSFGLHYGAEKIGATVIPISSGNARRQIMVMQDFGTTALVCTPSYALYLLELAEEMGVSRGDLKLKHGLFGAEPWSESMRKEIESKLGITATDNYGLSEVIGPGVAGECLERNGHHIFEDHFIAEVIDPETGEALPIGERGELVFTTLTKEAFPVIRYRTRDISSLNDEPCPCGRTLIRMERVRGRTDDMLIVRGVNIFPSQIEHVLLEIDDTEPHYQIIVDRQKGALDDIEIWVEVSESIFFDEMKRLRALEKTITNRMRDILGLSTKIKLVEPRTIERSTGKAKRVIDRREVYPE